MKVQIIVRVYQVRIAVRNFCPLLECRIHPHLSALREFEESL